MAAPSNAAGQPKCDLRNASDGLRNVLPAHSASGQQVYPRISASDGLRIDLPGQQVYPKISASNGLTSVLPAPAASGQQVYTRRSAFDGLIIAPPAPAESSSGMKHLPYDVFINHHGQDTKKTVAKSIYEKVNATGLRVFLDKDELQLGDFFPRTLEEAMASASLHIAIFSQNYVQSPWCLAELAFILERRNIIFIPIFYRLEPSALRWASKGKGIYGEALNKPEMKIRYGSEKVESWRLALHKASLYTGEIIKDQRAPKYLQNHKDFLPNF